jgi:hypothetical protein
MSIYDYIKADFPVIFIKENFFFNEKPEVKISSFRSIRYILYI